jgi:WD40 repeat protein
MLTIWDLARLVCCRTLPQPQGAVKSISWSHDSEYVAFADDEHNCEIVKVDTGGPPGCRRVQVRDTEAGQLGAWRTGWTTPVCLLQL